MLYAKVDCPHCGNEVTFNNAKEIQKCCWCRRLVSVKFEKPRKNGKRIRCDVKAVDFPDKPNEHVSNNKNNKNLDDWTDKDIYGHKRT